MITIANRQAQAYAFLGTHTGRSSQTSRELTTLHVIYYGGMHDGQKADFDSRDVVETTFSIHRVGFTIMDRYRRTTFLDRDTGRTIFDYIGGETRYILEVGFWRRLMLRLGLARPSVVVNLG